MFPFKSIGTSVRPLVCFLSLPLVLVVVTIVTAPNLQAAPPQWWYNRGVIDDTQLPNDYAAVNQGQVKFIAEQAAAELDAHCPGGAGDIVHTLIATWGTPTATTNDYSAVNLGQLKALAQPFYDRLIYATYTNVYPWNGSLTQANNYAAANVGQVKNLFSFDLASTDAAYDTNGDGLPDWWERFYHVPSGVHATDTVPWGGMTYLQAFQQGLNPVDFYNGAAPTFAHFSGDGDGQHGAPGEFVPLPLMVSATTGGNPLVNAPIKFSVTQGAGQVQRSSNSTPGQSITVLTDYSGQAKVFFKLSTAVNDQNQIKATPGSGGYSVSQSFTEFADKLVGVNHSPFDPSDVSVSMNPDGSGEMSWTNNTDPTDTHPIEIRLMGADGKRFSIGQVPAGSTSFSFPAR